MLYKKQSDYTKAEPLLLEAVDGRRLKLGDTQPYTKESWNNLIELYEARSKPKKAKEWRAKLPRAAEKHLSRIGWIQRLKGILNLAFQKLIHTVFH